MEYNQVIEIINIIIKLLDVVAWPLAVGIIIFLFRKELTELFNDLVDMKFRAPGGAEFTLARKQMERVKTKPDDVQENTVRNEEHNDTSNSADVKDLEKQLEETKEWVEFEQIYREILGSQISLLEDMLTFFIKKSGVFYLFFENHFRSVSKSNPALSSWTTSDYLQYLFLNGLITQTQGDPVPIYNLTEKGFNFIHYLNWRGYSKQKLF